MLQYRNHGTYSTLWLSILLAMLAETVWDVENQTQLRMVKSTKRHDPDFLYRCGDPEEVLFVTASRGFSVRLVFVFEQHHCDSILCMLHTHSMRMHYERLRASILSSILPPNRSRTCTESERSDMLAFSCSKQVLRNQHQDPSTFENTHLHK